MGTTTTPLAVLMASFCLNPVEDVAKDRVDLVELNHFHDEEGKHVFDQVIFYDWNARAGHYDVRAWRLVKHRSQIPFRDWERGQYVTLWQDGTVMRKVQAQTMRESWTQHDPELVERSFLPKEQRRELRKILIRQAARP